MKKAYLVSSAEQERSRGDCPVLDEGFSPSRSPGDPDVESTLELIGMWRH